MSQELAQLIFFVETSWHLRYHMIYNIMYDGGSESDSDVLYCIDNKNEVLLLVQCMVSKRDIVKQAVVFVV